MSLRIATFVWTAVVVITITPVAAQITPASGADGGVFGRRRPVDPSVTSQELTTSFDVATGADRNSQSNDPNSVPTQFFGPQQSGVINFVSGSAEYRLGRQDRFVAATGRGYASYATGGIEQVWSSGADLRGGYDISRRVQISGAVDFRFSPLFLYSSFSPLPQQPDQADLASPPTPRQGVTEQPWLSTTTTLGLAREWSLRSNTSVQYSRATQRPLEGSGIDGLQQSGSVNHAWAANRSVQVAVGYRFKEDRQAGVLVNYPALYAQSATLGISYERQLSASRRLRASGSVGATQFRADGLGETATSMLPNYSASFGVSLTRSWDVNVLTGRDTSLLQGVSPEPFVATATSLRLGENLNRRLQVSAGGGWSRGASVGTGAGAFDNATATAQMQVALTRQVAAFATYGYYDYALRDVLVVVPGFPDRYSSHSVRVGATVWLPVFGRF